MNEQKDPFTFSDDNQIATNTVTGEQFQAESTEGQYGCPGCHFDENTCDDACWCFPCNEEEWADGCSRIWKKIVHEGAK